MPTSEYYAHIAQDGRKQTVMEHVRGTAERAELCLAGIGLGKSAYVAGLFHDMGKFTGAFQSYLKEGDYSKRGSVIHTFQGCRYLMERIPNEDYSDHVLKEYAAELLAFAVGAHHGLFDCVDETGRLGLKYRKEKENTSYQEAVAVFFSQENVAEEIPDCIAQSLKEIDCILSKIEKTYEKNDEYMFEVGLLERMLLSAVIEGDRYDTAHFMNQHSQHSYIQNLSEIWKEKLQFLEDKIALFPINNPVNRARTEISQICRDFAERPKGIYQLNVPTGGGKTLSALRYALAHAWKHNHKRLIFTSPLLSILEQNAAVIREFVGDDRLILEHHSNVVQTEQTKEYLDERELDLQNWDTPIIITTLVQLLNCMFDGKTSSVRRFQALCESVIVIDEVQTVPTKLLSLFNLAIRFLTEQCESTVILCSATQPYWESADHPLMSPPNIVPYDSTIWDAFSRTHLQPIGGMRLEELPNYINTLMDGAESLLVVCNKKSEAAFLLERTKSTEYVSYHLSASMCMQHRRDVVAELKASLSRKEKTLCISTQVIEAGVDISFQRVIRLTAGMDSIVQSAGRCNRNGESKIPCPVYIVNCTDENLGKLQDIQRGKTATISLFHAFEDSKQRFNNDLASDSSIHYFYKAFYSDMNEGAQDYPLPKINTTILDLSSENMKFSGKCGPELEHYALWQAFKTAGLSFSVFDNNTIDVIVPYRAGSELISELSSARSREDHKYREKLLKEATGYTVSLYDYQQKRLDEKGALLRICDGFALAVSTEYSDEYIGLEVDESNHSFWEV